MNVSTLTTPRDFAQHLKQLVAIEQIVAEYVPSLVRRGTSFKGLCPFHKEKTPSFHVHPEQGFYHCFGCQAHGDILKFIQEIEKIDFMLALEQLAHRAGVEMPRFQGGAERTVEQGRRLDEMRELCAWAETFFIAQLLEHPRGKLAREYLIGRGLTDEQIGIYRLGYAPDGYETLLLAAAKKGWRAETVTEAGLASRRDQGGFLDRFRDRVMFPIADRVGQVVAFAGRLIEKRGDAAKYINSAETPIFHKSSLLYGVARAREAIKKENRVILLEGYMDWIALHRRGIQNVLAGMGTMMTEEQARLIKRMTGHVTLIYDGDEPGQKAMFRTTELLLRQGLDIRAAVLPAEHDPDSYIEAEGVLAMRDILSRSPSALDHFVEQAARMCVLSSPEGKADAVSRVSPLLLAIEEPALREGYMTRSAGRFGLRLETLEAAIRRRRVRRFIPDGEEPEGETATLASDIASRSEQNLLYILLQKKDHWDLLQNIDPVWFQNEELRSIFERFYGLMRDVREGGDPPEDVFSICENDHEKQWLSRIMLLPSQRFEGEVNDFDYGLADALRLQTLKLKKQWIQRRKRELGQDLEMILGATPLGTGQLEAIDRLSKESISWHAHLLDRSGMDGH